MSEPASTGLVRNEGINPNSLPLPSTKPKHKAASAPLPPLISENPYNIKQVVSVKISS